MTQGLRYDEGKVRWDLLPYDSLHEVAKVSTKGSIKYAPRNWERGMAWSKMVACAMRHLFARMTGERLDPETGLPHLAHFAWNALSLLAYDLRGIGENDLEDCAQGPRPETLPGVPIEPPKGGVIFPDLLYRPECVACHRPEGSCGNPACGAAVFAGDQSLATPTTVHTGTYEGSVGPLGAKGTVVIAGVAKDEPYEGVTHEEDRLGCSFLRFLPEFGARRK